MERIERIAAVNELLDIYGILLTQRQRDALSACYQEDLSLAEIAEETGSTRQAVHDLIHRGERQLLYYEEQRHILADQQQRRALLSRLERLLLQEKLPTVLDQKIRSILEALSSIK